jgi:hypothetical protein
MSAKIIRYCSTELKRARGSTASSNENKKHGIYIFLFMIRDHFEHEKCAGGELTAKMRFSTRVKKTMILINGVSFAGTLLQGVQQRIAVPKKSSNCP